MNIQLGQELFMFDSFTNWCDTAQQKFKNARVTSINTVCIDANGLICTIGIHFTEAEKNGSYPVRVYLIREDMNILYKEKTTSAGNQ